MKRNVGGLDRTWRFLVGPALFFAGIVAPVNMVYKVIFMVFGVMIFLTGVLGYCFLWTLLGINTEEKEK